MIEWLAVILLIAIGIGLMVAEVIFIPGVTVVGFLGFVFVIAGVIISFVSFDRMTGFVVLGGALISGLTALFIGFKAGAWEKFSLKSSINSRFNEDLKPDLKIGEKGITLSACRPMGKAEFKDRVFEIRTMGNYLPPGSKIRIIQITGSRIFVEPINE